MTLSDRPHAIVVGAGIVGAACAARLSRDGCRVTILDRAFASGVPYLVNVVTDASVSYPRSTILA